MSDLQHQLAGYIDAIAAPVTAEEVIAPLPEPPRRRVWIAALAGAAAVIAPFLAFLALRGPDREDVVTPTTTVTSTTIEDEPGPTTTVADALIMVPDLVGLQESEARAMVEAMGLLLGVTLDPASEQPPGTIVAQERSAGETVAPGTVVAVMVSGASCRTYEPPPASPAPGEVEVQIMVDCDNPTQAPTHWWSLSRQVARGANPYEEALRGLLSGLTETEQTAGFISWFGPEDRSDALVSAQLSEGTLVADFNDRIIIDGITTSTGGLLFNAELHANLFRFPEVGAVELRLNGSCEAWSELFQSDGCRPLSRAEWEQRVEEWSLERTAADVEIVPIPPGGLAEGYVTSHITVRGDEIVWVAADGSAASVIVRFGVSQGPARSVTSDRRGGIAYLNAGRMHWLQAGAADALPMPWFFADDLIPIVAVDDVELPFSGPVVVTNPFGTGSPGVFDLGDEGVIPIVEDYLAAVRAGRPVSVALVVDGDGSFLVATNPQGEELLRLRMSSDVQPAVWIDDFDGRRVLVTRSSSEPAAAPQTSFLIDLVCGPACTGTFYTFGYADLSINGPFPASDGAAIAAGPWLELRACSADGLDPEVDVSAMPGETAGVVATLIRHAARCDVAALEAMAADAGTSLAIGAATVAFPIISAESAAGPYFIGADTAGPVRELYEALTSPFATVASAEGGTSHVWPSVAAGDVDWAGMSDAEAADLASRYGAEVVAASRIQGAWAGWSVEIDAQGRWSFFGTKG